MPLTRAKRIQRSLWKGPHVDGITQSMLSRFISCRERFRIRFVEGLQPTDTFRHALEYGNMWHLCEEAVSESAHYWEQPLKRYVEELCQRYPMQQEEISKWYNVCLVQYPIYHGHWKDWSTSKPLFRECEFDIPYIIPDGRVIRLRGKWDGADVMDGGTYLLERKTKGDIVEQQLKNQLTFDMQTMFYLVAMRDWIQSQAYLNVKGVIYDVVRRPLSGGKGSIRQHKPTKSKPSGESSAEFYKRLEGIIRDDPEYYFLRWRVEVSRQDVRDFQEGCLDPLLTQLCDWWEEVVCRGDGKTKGIHWRHPYGIYNVLDRGGVSELDEYLHSGSTLGLEKSESLFEELE